MLVQFVAILSFATTAISLATLPSSSAACTDDRVSISQTINLFPILVDSWRYSEMSRVFTPDCYVYFGDPNPVLRGVPAVENLLRNLEGTCSQHGITTQYIELTGPNAANAETYLTSHFFEGKDVEPSFTEYGK
ncbi:hypothetical protein G7Y79_00014g037640 [Physcia stellaris]|nr:hypothetical protein G7Y79_00014g037640 [Physcia stellaris]